MPGSRGGPRGRVAGAAAANNATAGAEMLAAQTVDEDRFFLVHTLVTASRTRSRLLVIHGLLSRIVQAARGVVKGTESQRRFNGEFSQFCRTILLGLVDLEDAVFERCHPGRLAADATDDEVRGIAERDLMREIAAFVATQTPALTAPYLEHVAAAAVAQHARQQQRQVTNASTASASGTATSSRKHVRAASSHATTSNGIADRAAGGSAAAANGVSSSLGEDDPGLLDERELVARAQLLAKANTAPTLTAASSSLTPAPAAAAATLPDGVIRTAEGRTYDLRRPAQRLTDLEELRLRLEPWNAPQPFSAVELERVGTDRDRDRDRRAAADNAAAATTAAGASSSNDNPLHAPLLSVCLAGSPQELLRAWEAREQSLPGRLNGVLQPSVALSHGRRQSRRNVPAAGADAVALSPPSTHTNSGGGRGRSPQSRSSAAATNDALAGSGDVQNATDADVDGAEVRGDFFPSMEVRANVSVPAGVMRDLVHNGVASIEFLYS